MSGLKDAGHLFRFAGLFVLAFLVFLVVRHYVVPKSFGQYGHYRGAAMGEIAQHPAKFAGHETCETCHADVAEKTRRRVYDMLVAEKLQVQGFHYPFPGLGHVEKDGSGYRVIPAPWNPTI